MKKIMTCVTTGIICAGLLAGCAGAGGETASGADPAASSSSEAQASDTGEDADQPTADTADNGSLATNTAVEQIYFPEMPEGESESSIYVQKIDGLPDDFICGMDVSSLISEEASGVKYYDADGSEADPLKILADAGIDCIRVRVWNDPFDADGHGYGGGNCTAETAAELGARAAAYGMDTCVDFHYSDFWADPNKQMCPKAWEGLSMKDKQQALHDFTTESLHTILDAGASVTMVQIGNETNHGLAGEYPYSHIVKLFKSGSEAVREVSAEYGTDISVVVHFTAVDDAVWMKDMSDKLANSGLDYDVFGISYYPYWHGSMTNMVNVLKYISDTHNVKTCVMETSYMYTGDDGDGSANSLSGPDELPDYPVSIQGQANAVRDVCAAASEAGAIGVFYWEGAWIPVPSSGGSRSDIWEEYGSGWASSYASEYDPDDAGRYYGGCSWDNQAFFDFDGHVLESVNVFKYLKYGAKGDHLEVLSVEEPELLFSPGDEIVMPDEIPVVYNDSSLTDGLNVTWDEADMALLMASGETGEYTVRGKADPGQAQCSDAVPTDADGMIEITASVRVANENLLLNPSFEDKDRSTWTVNAPGGADPTDYQDKSADAHTGDIALHFWDTSAMEFEIEQEIVLSKAGTYTAEAWMQGGDFGTDDEVWLYVVTADGEMLKSDNVSLDGWLNWKNPKIDEIPASEGDVIKVGAHVKCVPKAWATFDDFSLNLK